MLTKQTNGGFFAPFVIEIARIDWRLLLKLACGGSVAV